MESAHSNGTLASASVYASTVNVYPPSFVSSGRKVTLEVICLINRIVHEIRMALSHELYLSALALALTLPDTCGKAEYPNEKYSGARYKKWCSQYVISDRHDSPYGYDMPYLSEEIIYNLRNSLLHQSTPNIEKSTIHESRCRVDKFELVITGEDGTNGDLSEVAYDKDMNIVQRGLKVHISHLCYILSTAAEDYYKNNKEKFDFIKYSIEDDRQKTIL